MLHTWRLRWLLACAWAAALAGCGGGGSTGGSTPAVTTDTLGVPRSVAISGSGSLTASGGSDRDLILVFVSSYPWSDDTTVVVNGGTSLLAKLPTTVSRAAARDSGVPPGPTGLTRTARGRATIATHRTFNLAPVALTGSVPATVRYTGSNVVLYVDDSEPSNLLSDAQVADLGAQFDQVLYPRVTGLCGQPSDVDSNQRVLVLCSPRINERGYGAFAPSDIAAGAGNDADLLYMLAPLDQAGKDYATLGPAMRATFAHELQHLVNYNQKVLVRQVPTGEQSWLNEGISFNIEPLVGLADTPGGPPEKSWAFFESPESYTLLELTGAYKRGHAGCGFLFVRYLVDHYGEQILTKLDSSALVGQANVAAATGAVFADVFSDWAAAVYLNNTGLNSDSRYALPGFQTRATYATVTLAGPRLTTVDGSNGQPAFRVNLPQSGVRYVRVTKPAASGVTLSCTAPANDQVRLLVIPVPAGT